DSEDYTFEIASHNVRVAKILRDHPNDEEVADYTITTFAYSIFGHLPPNGPCSPCLIDEVCLLPVLSALLDTLRNHDFLLEKTLQAAVSILEQTPSVCPKQSQVKDVPSLLAYYSALTRGRHLRTRCNGIGAMLGLGRVELLPVPGSEVQPIATHSGHKDGRVYLSQENLLAELPEDLRPLLFDYGVDACESVVESRCSADTADALIKHHQDNDARALGLRLAKLLQHTEFVINPDADLASTDGLDAHDLRRMPLYVLTQCAASLEDSDSAEDLDAAAVVGLHFLLVMEGGPESMSKRGRLALERNPNLAYVYYVMSFSASDVVSRYRAIKKGLASEVLTPFLRRHLLFRKVVVAGEHAISLLREVGQEAPKPDAPRLAMAYFKEAIDAAKLYIEIAPPDTRHLPEVLSWYIVLQIISEGPGLRDDLSEYEIFPIHSPPLLVKLATAERFTEILYGPSIKTAIQYAREWLFEHYRSGSVRQSERLVTCLGEISEDRASWTPPADNTPPPLPANTFSAITANGVQLDQCSYCETATASVRKCSRCGQAR
ncbi:hypothetical protein V8D89_006518, partial [Ganoderma adspersum]